MDRTLATMLIVAAIIFAGCSAEPRAEGPVAITPGENLTSGNLSCVYEIDVRMARGDSLKGIIDDGTPVRIYYGYYQCNKLSRDDIVVYNYSSNPVPVVKLIKGVPGDALSLQEENGTTYIALNGARLRNSDGKPYAVNDPRTLSLYINDYKGRIPTDAVLILGNTDDSLDSRRFGLVDTSDILGKAVVEEAQNGTEYADLLAGNYWAYRSASCSSEYGCTATATCPSGTTIQGYYVSAPNCGTSSGSNLLSINQGATGSCTIGATSCAYSRGSCGEQTGYAYVAILCTSN